MHSNRQFLSIAFLSATLLGGSSVVASAREIDRSDGADHAVFVQTNDLARNQVLAYHRAANGALTLAATYDTGGTGFRLNGAGSDPLASQGSLIYDHRHALLIGVNAGSHSVYAFRVDGDKLSGRQVIASGGPLPTSVTVHDNLAYVVDAGGTGSVQGFRIDDDGRLSQIGDSARTLGLTVVTDTTQFLNTPGQIGFTPNGEQLIVTTKFNGSHIDVFQVREDGRLSQTAVANPSATPVPFAITFDAQGQLVVAQAGGSNVSTYALHGDGTLTTLGTVSDGQAALCWIVPADGNFFGANTGSADVSAFHIDATGTPSLIGTKSVGLGPIDLSASHGGEFLYVQLGGSGAVAELAVSDDGSLQLLGTIATHAGQEGIVAF